MLRPATVLSDNEAFTGSDGAAAQAMAEALTRSQPGLADRLRVVPGVEIRSEGDLLLGSDWNLMPASGSRTAAPMNLTLRAAGDLTIASSLSDGFVAVAGSSATAIAATGVAQGEGGSFRLVGGADLAAADPLAVRRDGTGNVVIGRDPARAGGLPPSVFVRTTTGDIEVAAAGDIEQLNSQARVYTTGTAAERSELPQLERITFGVNQLARGATTGSVNGPFFEDAGDISLRAGGDVIGAPGTTYNASGGVVSTQVITDWWYRLTGLTNPQQPLALWSRYDLFGQGFASFGGGDIAVRAGGDVVDLELSTPTTGYSIGARVEDGVTLAPAAQRWFRGGTLDVVAGGDVVSGLFNAGGASARLVAGGAVRPAEQTGLGRSHPATQLFYGDTDWQVRAGGALTVGSLTNPALMPGVTQGPGLRTDLVDGLAPGASASLASLTGALEIVPARPTLVSSDTRFGGTGSRVVPDELLLVATGGSVNAGPITQRPAGSASLMVLAEDDATIGALRLTGADAAQAPLPVSDADLGAILSPANGRWNTVDTSGETSRDPVRVVSATGDVRFGEGAVAFSSRPLRVSAAGDLVVDASLQVQHEPAREGEASEMTLLQAGRDLRFTGNATLRLGGPGDLLVVAARDLSLGGGPGIVTVGNQDNPRGLPAGGANVTLLSGVSLGALDYGSAVAQQFHLVGAGLESFPAELAVQLEALQAGQPLPTGEALRNAAKAFNGLDAAAQRERVRGIVGAEAFDAGVAEYVDDALARIDALSAASAPLQPAGSPVRVPGSQFLRSATGPGGVPLNAAQVREALKELLAQQALGDLLAQHLASSRFDAATQRSVALAISPYAGALAEFMRTQGAPAGLSAAEAALRFEALPAERQALFLNRVLFEELRASGRGATLGERIAYLRGYQALDVLFPGTRASGTIDLSSSQLKTQQGGDIRLLTPGGGVNVGELGAGGTGKSASELGIVTVAGGRIETAVRDNLDVNQSRVFTLARGDLLLWSGLGNLDAGRGAKTVTGSPPPLFTINDKGQLVVDTSGSFSGSGIAVLDAGSSLDLYAPLGEINAGDAGIQSRGTTFLGAGRIVNADALQLSGPTVGAPPPAPTSSANASLGAAAQSATSAGSRATDDESEDEKRKKRRARRNLLLDFLGFGTERS